MKNMILPEERKKQKRDVAPCHVVPQGGHTFCLKRRTFKSNCTAYLWNSYLGEEDENKVI